MYQMRMRAPMPGTLGEGQMLMVICIVHPFRGETPDGFRQQVGKVRGMDFFRYLGLRLLGGVYDQRMSLYQWPFDGLQGAIHFETLPVLPRDIEQ
jgi:hypothetical protein